MVFGKYFYGNEISTYGQEHGFVDYGTLAKSFNHVYNGYLFEMLQERNFYLEQINGKVDYSDEIEDIEDKIYDLECEAEEASEEEQVAIGEKIEELQNQIDELKEAAESKDVMQWYIIDDSGRNILCEYTNEIVYECEELDLTLWGVTHWGTNWDYVLTNIPCTGKDPIYD